jgi:hypothetical protein
VLYTLYKILVNIQLIARGSFKKSKIEYVTRIHLESTDATHYYESTAIHYLRVLYAQTQNAINYFMEPILTNPPIPRDGLCVDLVFGEILS